MIRSAPVLAIAVLLIAIAFALSPLMSNSFAGYTPEQFPVQEDSWPVQPAGWAFSIWGVIFIWLIVGSIWGLLNAPFDQHWNAMRRPLLASLGIGVFWIAAANFSPILATIMIWSMAALAVAAFLRSGSDAPNWQARPVALYAGWLTAATGVGTAVVLGGYGLLSSQTAALVMLAAVLGVALAVQSLRPTEWAYPLAIIWALSGVIAANAPSGNWPVIALAALGIAMLALRFLRHRSRRLENVFI